MEDITSILDRASKAAEKAELYLLTSEELPVTFEANKLKILEGKQTKGVALRIVKNGRVGLASTTNMAKLNDLIDQAVETAQFGAEAKFDLPSQGKYADLPSYCTELEKLQVDRMIDMGRDILEQVRSYSPDLLCDVEIEKNAGTVRIINTNGLDVSFSDASFGIGVHVNWIRDTDMLDVYESEDSVRADIDYKKMVDKLLNKIKMAERIAPLQTCQVPVIFTPKGIGMALVGIMSSALNGKVVFQGASPLGDKMGQKIADERISLFDDGTIPDRPSSRPFDDEGVPTRRTPMIENGVLKNFYYDLQTAGLAGAKSTGNGFRGLGSLPSPSNTALVFPDGDTPYEEMVKSVKQGVIVDQTMGAWAGNLLAGDFSGNIHLGYKIENGEVVGRVKDTMIAGNVFEALKQIGPIGTEAEWLGGLKTPAILFENLSVAAKGCE